MLELIFSPCNLKSKSYFNAMGEHQVRQDDRAAFVQSLLKDLEALEHMLGEGHFAGAKKHIGAEQELCLIDYQAQPAMINMELLDALNDPLLTTELAQFNLELNLPPLPLGGASLSSMENELTQRLTEVNRVAHKHNAKIILTGILPTISARHMDLKNMTPNPRYRLLNDIMYGTKGAKFEMHIRGIDELNMHSDTVLYESCNTSFQVHLQIDPEHAARELNWAKMIAGPILSACTNSPIFFGKRLWRETRIALFHQSTDIRKDQGPYRKERARVDLGDKWYSGSAIDYYRDTVTRHRALLTPSIDEDPFSVLEKGRIPKLKALNLHNGTIYKWDRLCYGVTEGKPHLRIECRYLPSGPSILDEVANTALWLGCMLGRPKEYDGFYNDIDHDLAILNFFRAAREGMRSVIHWVDGKERPSKELLLEDMIPMAKRGLHKAGFEQHDIDKYLNVIEARVSTGRTGSQWILDTYAKRKKELTEDQALIAVTEGIYQRQKKGSPVHEWTSPGSGENATWSAENGTVEQVMSKDLITVRSDEPLELVKNIMLWSNVHHIPVESDKGEFMGIVTAEGLLSHMFSPNIPATVKEAMDTDPVWIEPGTKIPEAIQLMQERECRYLPVVLNNKVLGIFTENDRMKMAQLEINQAEQPR